MIWIFYAKHSRQELIFNQTSIVGVRTLLVNLQPPILYWNMLSFDSSIKCNKTHFLSFWSNFMPFPRYINIVTKLEPFLNLYILLYWQLSKVSSFSPSIMSAQNQIQAIKTSIPNNVFLWYHVDKILLFLDWNFLL